MKKLFTAIRHGDLDEVKKTLANYPEVIDEAATAPPKKDKGLSPLQVALKIGEFDIAEYLIKQGADVNYIDPESDDEYVWRVPVLQDAIGAIFFAYEHIKPDIETAERATAIVHDMLERGADPNAIGYKTIVKFDEKFLRPTGDAMCACIGKAPLRNEKLHDIAEKKLTELLDLMLQHGADIEAWAKLTPGAYYRDDQTNRKCFIDDFVPEPDTEVTYIQRRTSIIPVKPGTVPELKKGDKLVTETIKHDKDNHADLRAFMRDFCRKRGLLGLN